MIKADFHTHSTHSTDGLSSMRQQIEAAIEKGLFAICLTEHMDYDNHMYLIPSFYEDMPGFSKEEAKAAFQCDTDKYMSELMALREEYKEKIDVCFGVELGLLEYLGDHYREYVQKYPFDFVLGSSHECMGADPYYREFIEKNETPEIAYRKYFEAELACAKACVDSFDVYGHLDYALRYHRPASFIFNYDDYKEVLDELLSFLIKNKKGIECNTAGFKYFGDEPHPHISILKRYKELGGTIITVGSDAHKSEVIAANFEKATATLKSCGFTKYAVFKNRKPEFYDL